MADILQTSSAWLESMREQHRTIEIRYAVPGEASSLRIQATVGRSTFELADSNGVVLQIQTRDYLVTASSLAVEPKAGHRIVDDGRVYEVSDIGAEPAWRWSDSFRQTYRIHCKEVKQ